MNRLVNETARFFGLRPVVYDSLKTAIELDEEEAEREERKWQQRRFRHLNKEYGVRIDAVVAELQRSENASAEAGRVTPSTSKRGDSATPPSDVVVDVERERATETEASDEEEPNETTRLTSGVERNFSAGLVRLDADVQRVEFFAGSPGVTTPSPPTTRHRLDDAAGRVVLRASAPTGACAAVAPTAGDLRAASAPKRTLPIFGSFDSCLDSHLRDESLDYRPFFTFWITTVQVIIMLVMLLRYGVGTDFSKAFGVIERSGDVTSTFLSMIHIVVWEQNNVWIGPRFADLVHAGAKYTPCMRQDSGIYAQILSERREEALNTGCCISAEDGCFQGSECPKQFARLLKWTNATESEIGAAASSTAAAVDGAAFTSTDAPSRVVCGQDSRYCIHPKSVPPFQWNPANISKWPICEELRPKSQIPRRAEHMHCTITGRPCCIQLHGQCRVTTPEYCAFVRGYFHANATLCSQVSCLNSVCGMTPFYNGDHPDQLYRLFTPLFMHAGIIRCAITVVLQMKIMRNFEVMIGWLRLSIIYFVSGVGGYLASAVFVPYAVSVFFFYDFIGVKSSGLILFLLEMIVGETIISPALPEVGPAGSQGGVLGALIVNVLYNWHFLKSPAVTLAYHVSIAAVLFLTGLLPFVDNWAQLFGFIFGCLLAAALIPYIVFGRFNRARQRRRRMTIVCVSLAVTLVLFVVLFALFYAFPATFFAKFDSLRLLNCPFSGKVCEQQGLFLRSWLPI